MDNPAPDKFRLNAARGWLELGDFESVNAELDALSPSAKAHPEVLKLRWEILAKAQKWPMAFILADSLRQVAPDHAWAWYATGTFAAQNKTHTRGFGPDWAGSCCHG